MKASQSYRGGRGGGLHAPLQINLLLSAVCFAGIHCITIYFSFTKLYKCFHQSVLQCSIVFLQTCYVKLCQLVFKLPNLQDYLEKKKSIRSLQSNVLYNSSHVFACWATPSILEWIWTNTHQSNLLGMKLFNSCINAHTHSLSHTHTHTHTHRLS